MQYHAVHFTFICCFCTFCIDRLQCRPEGFADNDDHEDDEYGNDAAAAADVDDDDVDDHDHDDSVSRNDVELANDMPAHRGRVSQLEMKMGR